VAAFGKEAREAGHGLRDRVGGGDTDDIEAFAPGIGEERALQFVGIGGRGG
jgi:hypothetical protein